MLIIAAKAVALDEALKSDLKYISRIFLIIAEYSRKLCRKKASVLFQEVLIII